MLHLELPTGPPGQDPDEFGFCCMGAAGMGLHRCTCWRPVYDVEQEPVRAEARDVVTRSKCCGDCAYRNGSPERADAYEEEALRLLAERAALDPDAPPFFCHDGLRRIVAWRHPDGRVVEASPGGYDPPTDPVRQIAWRADGTPADRCGGWAAWKRGFAGR